MQMTELILAVAGLVIFDLLAMRFGVDSRESFGKRAHRQPERPFFTAR